MRAWIQASLLALFVGTVAGCDVVSTLLADPPAGSAVPGATSPVDPFAPAQRNFDWDPRPGAMAYQVVASLDRGGTAIAAVSAFTSAFALPVSALAWREGHPSTDRAYFWVVRAYDRADPQGLLLATSDPREFRAQARDAKPWAVRGPEVPR